MADRNSGRSSNILCAIATTVIVVVGLFAFAYVGQQVSLGNGKTNVTIEMPTTTPWLVEEPDRDALRVAGLGNEDIFDLAETVAFFNLSNRMASATDMIPNREYHGTARTAGGSTRG